MKILCVTPSYWPAIKFGGPSYSVHGLNKALVKKGLDVTIFTSNVGIENEVTANQEVYVDGVKVTYFSYAKHLELLGTTGWQFSWQLINALNNKLKEFDLVYIVAVWNFPVAAAAYYCRKHDVPYLISPRGTLYPETAGKKKWKKWPYYKLIAEKTLKGAAGIHYTTVDERDHCHNFLNLQNKAYVIPNGIDLDEFRNLPEKTSLGTKYPHLINKKIILFLGRISWKKGLDILIKAFSRLEKEKDHFHLLIVGNDENNYAKQLKEIINQCGIKYIDLSSGQKAVDDDVKVTFTGMLKGDEKKEAFAGSDLFVLPSYSENFGISVIEAIAIGTPVIISNKVGLHNEIEKNKAGLVIEVSSESLYKGLMKMIGNDNLRFNMSINGKKMVEKFYNIDEVADSMMEVYKEVINSA